MKLLWTSLIAAIVAGGILAAVIFQRPAEVPVVRAVRGVAVDAVSANITVTSRLELTVRSERAGRVSETLVMGDNASAFIERGTVLAQLDTAPIQPLQARLAIEINALSRQMAIGQPAELTLLNLQQDLAANTERAAQGNFPESELAKERRNVQRLEREIALQGLAWETELAKLQREQAQLELDLERMTVRSPISGIVTHLLTVPGDYLFVGDAVARMISREVALRASIPEEDFPGVALGQAVLMQFLGTGNATFEGRIVELLPTSDALARRRDVLVQLNAPHGGRLVAGMTGEGSVIKERRDGAVVIPRRALHGSTEVYLVVNGIVERRVVTTGFIGLRQVEVTQGLQPGDLVVVQDKLTVSPGQTVNTRLVD